MMALMGASKILFRALPVLFVLSAAAFAQQKLPGVFTVANVRVETEAADAVEAKKRATQTAEMRAFRLLISRLTDFRAQAHMPDVPLEEVERLISNIDIRGEGVSATGYVASFGVTFSERAVGALLARYQIVPILDRGPEILIVPVFIEDGVAKTADSNPWRNALLALDLTHALVPAKVAPVRNDLTAAIANAYIANPAAGVETLKSQYRTSQLLFAVASTGAGGDEIMLKLIGNDASGQLSVQRKIRGQDAGEESLLPAAARLAFETIQQRWKLTRDTFVASGETAASLAAGGSGYGGGGVTSLLVTAQYSGLKEWQTIRTRLQNIPGIQNWDLKTVNPRAAQISFDFPGGADRLSAMAAGQGLSVENSPEGLVVKTR
jgi:hypothetical protein